MKGRCAALLLVVRPLWFKGDTINICESQYLQYNPADAGMEGSVAFNFFKERFILYTQFEA